MFSIFVKITTSELIDNSYNLKKWVFTLLLLSREKWSDERDKTHCVYDIAPSRRATLESMHFKTYKSGPVLKLFIHFFLFLRILCLSRHSIIGVYMYLISNTLLLSKKMGCLKISKNIYFVPMAKRLIYY